MRGAVMAGLALLALLIACVPAHGEEPSILVATDPMNPSTDPALSQEPLPSRGSDILDPFKNAYGPETANQSTTALLSDTTHADEAFLPVTESQRADEVSQPVTDNVSQPVADNVSHTTADIASQPVADIPQSDAQGLGHTTEGYEAAAHAPVPFLPPSTHTTPPSVT
jgi:hypothetical protein